MLPILIDRMRARPNRPRLVTLATTSFTAIERLRRTHAAWMAENSLAVMGTRAWAPEEAQNRDGK